MGQPHNREVEHGDPYSRVFVNNVAACGCNWSRGPITLPDGTRVGFGDVLHLCPLHRAHSDAEYARLERKRKRSSAKPQPGHKRGQGEGGK